MALAKAYPKKQFFVDMFTRDISLEDCILDLTDNSIDSILKIDQIDIAKEILASDRGKPKRTTPTTQVNIRYSPTSFEIEDNCGGIPYKKALEEVFCFGPPPSGVGKLGVYGVGLKRAIFKLGNQVVVESHTATDGFRLSQNLGAWADKDESLDDWVFPLTELSGVSASKAGTTIKLTELRDEVIARFKDPTLERTLSTLIARTYTVFMDSQVRINLNSRAIPNQQLPFGESSEIKPGLERFDEDGVKVELLASLAPRPWNQEIAGWYILCNGRAVVSADKSELTGWGGGTLPAFHSKFRGFVGLALFTSNEPLKLPWTTSKRGVNRESLVYQHARSRMAAVARPVINFLNNMYPSDLAEQPAERDIASRVSAADFRKERSVKQPRRSFSAKITKGARSTVPVKYGAEPQELDRIRKRLRSPGMSPSAIGRHTFDYFLKTECPE